MILDPPDITKEGFLRLLDEATHLASQGPPMLGGSTPCTKMPRDRPEWFAPHPRLSVQMEGRDRHVASVRGQRANLDLRPGDAVFWAANAWSIPQFDAEGKFLGVVFHPHCVRLIQAICTGQRPKSHPTPWAYHTTLPLGETGACVVRALSNLAEEGNNESPAQELFFSLLRLVRRHLQEDVPVQPVHTKAMRTWHAVIGYLSEQSGHGVSRKSVAAALGLHPNYLSALARQNGGQPFRKTLEDARISQARRLLRDTDLKLDRIAAICGYCDASRFAKAFRRNTGITPGRFRSEGMRPMGRDGVKSGDG